MIATDRRSTPDATVRPWHALSGVDTAQHFGVTPARGLDAEDVRRRREVAGPNTLPEPDRRRRVMLLVDQFRNPLILLLIGAAAIAAFVGDLTDSAVIAAVILVNSILGFVQESRAENSLESLRKMLAPTCVVRREGRPAEIAASELVPGDIVLLDAGSQVPADGRVLVAEQLDVDESALTGESVPTSKSVDPTDSVEATVGDRSSMTFMNTLVTRGRGEIVVTAVGSSTEMGQLAELIKRTPMTITPLQHQLAHLGKRLAALGGVAVLAYLVIGLLQGDPWDEIVLSAVALAVAAVPEGLPVVVTVTLAVGAHQMARQGALVKQLASVETLGSTSVVCTDKTGTLTLNEMTVRSVWTPAGTFEVSGEGYQHDGEIVASGPSFTEPQSRSLRRLGRAAALCNDSSVSAGEVIGDPMEGALLVLAGKAEVDVELARARLPRIAEVPFDAARRYMATVHADPADNEHVLVTVKGALDALLDRCTQLADASGGSPLDHGAKDAVMAAMNELASRGLRVLALADRQAPSSSVVPDNADELVGELTLLGIVGLQDPPRPGAAEAIASCHAAGIDVKMITGDHAATAEAIATELGITGRTCTGSELDATDHDAALVDVGVFARVSPEHKLRIVRALQKAGRVTAMTGDGVNDAPALRAADIGVAMGKAGTQVSRDAAAMVLTDDHFATIVKAVKAGRTIFANIVSFLRFQLTTNAGAIATMLAAPLLGLPTPLTAIQILWVNMIMDGPPAVALGMDPAEPDVMRQKPREAHVTLLPVSRIAIIVLNGSIMACGTLAVLAYGLSELSTEQAVTLAFTTFVLFQVVSALTVRSASLSIFHRRTFTNRALWISLAVIVALQVVVVSVPFAQGLFDTVALTPSLWMLAAGTASTLLIVDELRKLVVRHRDKVPFVARRAPTASDWG